MDVIAPTSSEIRGRTLERSTLQVTLGSLEGDKDQSSSIFSGFAGLLASLLVVVVFCILWNWNKWKKRRVPYLQVTARPLLTLPRPRQRAKNIYDLLPRRREDMGRHQSRSIRIVSTESLLSRNSDSADHVTSQAGNDLQVHRAHIHAMGYTVGVYDNATVPQMCAHYINARASRDCSSISSEDSHDYVNVPTAEETAETLASSNSPLRNLLVLPSAQELEFTEERDKDCGAASDCTSFWSPGTEGSDSVSDGEGSSQTSNDYVNMRLDLRAVQQKQSWVDFQCHRDYENFSPADPNGSQQQAEEEVTSSKTDNVKGKIDGSDTHIQPVTRKFLASGDYVAFQPSTQSENSQVKHGEEMSNDDSNDYENVLAAKSGCRNSEQEPGNQLPPDEVRPSCPTAKPCGVVYPAGTLATAEFSKDP
ncbi:PREDICTED: lymphocyte transmembrane adapter 1 isoform X1 [Galeopterus variegatus]|uniref:Lymphocyte transmembrane adapter 1 isoform X1 n=1 Tax=Galeopterus variegatus TaxID=482537 RepID=A0ABM0RPC7_GALVR|nr:PREDICTED: lymphocyte transmembrane adapter 1 isoform X1 [Galeopterus variegatus]